MDRDFFDAYFTNYHSKKDKEYAEKFPNLYGAEQATPSLKEPSLTQGPSLQIPPDAPTLTAPIPSAPAESAAPKPVDTFSDYWKTPIIGKMPLDKFVQMAGMLSKSINPNEPMGRMGADLYQMGGLASAERARREEKESDRQLKAPEDALRMRSLKAQVEKEEMPKEPKYNLDVQQNPKTKVWEYGRRNEATGIFTADRPATDKEKQDKIEGKLVTPTVKNIQIGDKIVPSQWDAKINKWIPISKGGPKWSPKDMTGKKAVDRDKAFKKMQELRENNINIQRVLNQTKDEMGKDIVRSPSEDAVLNKMFLTNEAEIGRLSKKYPDLLSATTQPTVGTLTPEQIKMSKEMYADLTSKGMSSIDAIKAINAKLNSITPSNLQTDIPPEPPGVIRYPMPPKPW